MASHEYTLLGGTNRSGVGKLLARLSATISAITVFVVLTVIDVAQYFGWAENLPPTLLSILGAGTVYALIYPLFNRFAWRWGPINRVLKVPDLSGEWKCAGKSMNSAREVIFEWEAKVSIMQSWDRVQIRLRTDQSESHSNSAALIWDDTDEYRLIYSYRNVPRIDQAELESHVGFSELVFSADRKNAEGLYFNGQGRFTFGTMTLSRA